MGCCQASKEVISSWTQVCWKSTSWRCISCCWLKSSLLQKHGSEQPTLLHWSCLLTELHWLNKPEKLHYCINNNPLDLSFWLSFFLGECMLVKVGGYTSLWAVGWFWSTCMSSISSSSWWTNCIQLLTWLQKETPIDCCHGIAVLIPHFQTEKPSFLCWCLLKDSAQESPTPKYVWRMGSALQLSRCRDDTVGECHFQRSRNFQWWWQSLNMISKADTHSLFYAVGFPVELMLNIHTDGVYVEPL